MIAEAAAEGRPRAVPSFETVHRHFTHWAAAMAAAGFEPLRRHQPTHKRGPQGPRGSDYTREQVVDAVRAASAAWTGSNRLTDKGYTDWRSAQIEAGVDPASLPGRDVLRAWLAPTCASILHAAHGEGPE